MGYKVIHVRDFPPIVSRLPRDDLRDSWTCNVDGGVESARLTWTSRVMSPWHVNPDFPYEMDPALVTSFILRLPWSLLVHSLKVIVSPVK